MKDAPEEILLAPPPGARLLDWNRSSLVRLRLEVEKELGRRVRKDLLGLQLEANLIREAHGLHVKPIAKERLRRPVKD